MSKFSRGDKITGVPRESAAAALRFRHEDFHAVAREDFDGGDVDVGSEHLLRAAGQQSHPPATFAVRRVCAPVEQEFGADGLRAMGRCMNALKQKFPGRMDFGKAGALVKQKLG